MSHLDEGTLLALRDGGAVEHEAGARAHLESCATCREALDELRRAHERVGAALASLDEPFDVEAARARVRARVAAHTAERSGARSLVRPRRGLQALARAAGLVLLVSAGAYALPGSPVRGWVDAVLSPEAASVGSAAVEPATEAPAAAATPTAAAGIRVGVAAPVRVSIRGLAAGDELTVRWVPTREVAVFGPDGSRFASGASQVRATVPGGPVEVELPQEVRPLTLEVDGRVYVRTVEGAVITEVEPEARDGRSLRFRIAGGGGA